MLIICSLEYLIFYCYFFMMVCNSFNYCCISLFIFFFTFFYLVVLSLILYSLWAYFFILTSLLVSKLSFNCYYNHLIEVLTNIILKLVGSICGILISFVWPRSCSTALVCSYNHLCLFCVCYFILIFLILFVHILLLIYFVSISNYWLTYVPLY